MPQDRSMSKTEKRIFRRLSKYVLWQEFFVSFYSSSIKMTSSGFLPSKQKNIFVFSLAFLFQIGSCNQKSFCLKNRKFPSRNWKISASRNVCQLFKNFKVDICTLKTKTSFKMPQDKSMSKTEKRIFRGLSQYVLWQEFFVSFYSSSSQMTSSGLS